MRIYRREREEGKRPHQVNIRLSECELAALEQAARKLDMGVSTFVAVVALDKANRNNKKNRKPK